MPSGYVADDTDCDDGNAAIHPAATEVCDEADNDRDGAVDEDGATGGMTWYADTDGDGHGDPDVRRELRTQPSGHVANATDCDDTDSAVSPVATEVLCDGRQ